MLINRNIEIEFFENIFKNESTDLIFIDSWDSIYIYNQDKYEKSDYSFCDNHQYTKFINDITDGFSSKINSKKDFYLKISHNIDITIHMWDYNDFWVILKRNSSN